MTTNFEKYYQYKDELSYFDSLDMANVLAYDVGIVAYFKESISFKSILINIFSCYDFKKDISKDNLFTIGEYGFRKDYMEILDYASSEVESKEIVNFSKKLNICIPRLKTVFDSYNVCRGLFEILTENKSKMFVFSRTMFYLNSLRKLKKRKFNVTNYIAFSSVHTFESLLTNYLSSLGVRTYTLQHGVAHIHTGNIPLDMLSYENFNADFQLCWGQYSKEEYISYGIKSESLMIAGYPKNIQKTCEKEKDLEENSIIIFLARHKYHESNIFLLEKILKNTDYKLFLKPHPSLRKEDYKTYLDADRVIWLEGLSVTEAANLKKWPFSISINTSAYYESFLNKVVSFMYLDEEYEGHKIIVNTGFCTIDELLIKVSKLNKEEEEIYKKELSYILGNDINRYNYILNDSENIK